MADPKQYKTYLGFPQDYNSPEARLSAQAMGGWPDVRNMIAEYRAGGEKPELSALKNKLYGLSVEESGYMEELIKALLAEKSGGVPFMKFPDAYDDPEAQGGTPKGGSRYMK